MTAANILRRETSEAIYPRDVFEADAANNSMARITVSRGVRIECPPNANGNFRPARAAHPVGEVAASQHGLFFCPYMGRSYGLFSLARSVHGPVGENADPFEAHPEEHDAFIDRIVDAAKRCAQAASIADAL